MPNRETQNGQTGSRRRPLSRVSVLLLAGGDGRRLANLTLDREGKPAPKQFSVLFGEKTLLDHAYGRARRLVPHEKVFSVVARKHEHWWSQELSLDSDNIVVQPDNRGTAIGVLLPILHILMRNPADIVVALPSDHFIRDEETFENAVRLAIRRLRVHPKELILLGMVPTSSDGEFGWILPRGRRNSRLRRVDTFVEKPGPERAEELLDAKGLWSTFVFVGKGMRVLELIADAQPDVVSQFLRTFFVHNYEESVDALYRELPTLDFSRDVLQKSVVFLRALAVPDCGWTDLGTPDRYREWKDAGSSIESNR